MNYNLERQDKLLNELKINNKAQIKYLREIRDQERAIRVEKQVIMNLEEYQAEKRKTYKDKMIRENLESFNLVLQGLKDEREILRLNEQLIKQELGYIAREFKILDFRRLEG